MGDSKKGWVQDVSQSGAFLWNCYIADEHSKVVFKIKDKKPIVRNCRVVRKDQQRNWAAIQFDEQLTPFEFSRVTDPGGSLYLPGENATYDLAKIDRAEVFRGAVQIKTCASNYFIWAMGLILPITFGVWALAMRGAKVPGLEM